MRRILLLSVLALLPLRALAAPGELDAVVRHCGTPLGESHETSPVDNHLQRTLTYNGGLLLHFEPETGGWGFTTGWHGHTPISRAELEQRLPCFRSAMEDAAHLAINPAIDPAQHPATQTTTTFGVPNFWLIVGLVAALLLLFAIPSARARKMARDEARNARAIAAASAHSHHSQPHHHAPPTEDPLPPRPHHIEPDLYR